MGVKSKKRHSEQRKAMKKAAKAAKKALYESYAKQGKQKKKKNQTVTGIAFNHEKDNCGNPGCKKCFPRPKMVWATASI